ncbi:E3 ubiquitin-protein ligase hel2 [Linum grandiflorum]
MDDSCAVCADNLEWVAYGACGHRDVCSTCVVRLRFICQDQRCCICKTEADVVFVTKAMGDYTRIINDFSLLPSKPKEGKIGSYWYHEDTHAYFDDVDHYKMIKAMCRLSCSECDKMEEETNDVAKHRAKYRNIEQLKGHLFHVHKLVMCSLCLEGRKVFICEQKLFTRSQLSQHVNTGDSEVDGSESERGGFKGHSICEFCRTPFYGDNELFTHMTRDHYTCHICQRQHPGKYDYFKNYDELEIHFRLDHFLCEDESCLAKKFVVFQSESEMKRHNTIEHAGRMSRSKRNAALQACICSYLYIPTSFQFHREQDPRTRHGRGSGSGSGRGLAFRDDYPDDQLSMAIQASLESSGTQVSGRADGNNVDPITRPLESLALTESTPTRYREAMGNSSNAVLQESAFPPLPVVPKSTQQKKRKNKKATGSRPPQEWPASRASSSSSWSQWPVINNATSSSQNTFSPSPALPVSVPGYTSARPPGSTSQTRNPVAASSLTVNRVSRHSDSDFPPVSAMQVRSRTPSTVQVVPNDVQNANKSLVEKVRDALDQDEAKYASFKEISGQYRQGTIDSEMYLARVRIFGLSHLVLELARLCPDPAKQKELVDTYNASLGSKGQNGKGAGKAAKKGKGIASEGSSSSSNSRDRLADNVINTVRAMQPRYNPLEDEVEVLSKDGYRKHSKGKSSLIADQQELPGRHDLISQIARDAALAGGGSKQKKKISKFQRARLGDGSMSAMLDTRNSEPDPDPGLVIGQGSGSNGALPVRGVWRKGGGKKLFAHS